MEITSHNNSSGNKLLLTLSELEKWFTLNRSSPFKNDVIEILGQPHAKNFNEEDIWIYIERTLTKGKYHKLGRHELKSNNTLVLNFDKYGVLKSKDFYDKNDINKIEFSKKTTENDLSKKSFVETFLQSVKRKMYGLK